MGGECIVLLVFGDGLGRRGISIHTEYKDEGGRAGATEARTAQVNYLCNY